MWLERNKQCPTCRVPITEQNPARKINGEYRGQGITPSPPSQNITEQNPTRKINGESTGHGITPSPHHRTKPSQKDKTQPERRSMVSTGVRVSPPPPITEQNPARKIKGDFKGQGITPPPSQNKTQPGRSMVSTGVRVSPPPPIT